MNKKRSKDLSRREFLKKSAIGAGALGASSLGLLRFTYGAKPLFILGGHFDITGAAAAYGYWFEKVAKAVTQKINEAGGIDGREVKLVIRDTASNAEVGARAFRQLVLEDKVDMVGGSVHSGVHLACLPVSQELNTIYFSGGAMAADLTGEKLVPNYVRIHTHALMQAKAGWKFGFDNFGHKWAFVVADYAWGRSLADEFGKRIVTAGGKVQTIPAPPTTKDFIPYLQKIEPGTEVLFTAFLGGSALGVMRQTVELGLHEKMKRYTVICCTDGIGTDQVGKEAAGMYWLSYHPRWLDQVPEKKRPHDKKFRDLIGITPDGRDANDKSKVIVGSHQWAQWEYPWMIKEAVEKSGWKGKKDNPDFLKAFCNLKVKTSDRYYQGDLVMREEDRQGFHDHYLVKVDENLKLNTIKVISKEETMYEPPVDIRKWKG